MAYPVFLPGSIIGGSEVSNFVKGLAQTSEATVRRPAFPSWTRLVWKRAESAKPEDSTGYIYLDALKPAHDVINYAPNYAGMIFGFEFPDGTILNWATSRQQIVRIARYLWPKNELVIVRLGILGGAALDQIVLEHLQPCLAC